MDPHLAAPHPSKRSADGQSIDAVRLVRYARRRKVRILPGAVPRRRTRRLERPAHRLDSRRWHRRQTMPRDGALQLTSGIGSPNPGDSRVIASMLPWSTCSRRCRSANRSWPPVIAARPALCDALGVGAVASFSTIPESGSAKAGPHAASTLATGWHRRAGGSTRNRCCRCLRYRTRRLRGSHRRSAGPGDSTTATRPQSAPRTAYRQGRSELGGTVYRCLSEHLRREARSLARTLRAVSTYPGPPRCAPLPCFPSSGVS